MKRALVLLGALTFAVPTQAADGTCESYCERHVGCFSALAKADTGKPLPRGERDAALYRCISQCRDQGLPPSMLSCLATSSCADLGGPDGGPAFERCEPVGLAAISRALQLGSKSGDACTDVCRHRTSCFLGARANPTFDDATSHLEQCRDGCRTDFSDDLAFRDRYYACVTDVPCSRLTDGRPSAEVYQECRARAASGGRAAAPAVAGDASGPPPTAAAAAAKNRVSPGGAAPGGGIAARAGADVPNPGATARAGPTAPTPFDDDGSFHVQRLGAPISTRACETAPLIEPDGKALVFNRFDRKTLRDLGYFRSMRTASGWSTPDPYPVPAGARGFAFGADAQSIYYFAEVEPDAFGGKSADLLVARRVGTQWGPPVNLGPVVNSPGTETELSLTADGRTLVFASDRPGTVGIMDLYAATRDANGQWSAPRNLGPAINQSGDSQGSPRIAANGRALFFTAMLTPEGPLGLYVTLLDGSEWLPRRTLSPLVEGPRGDEIGLALAPSGDEAYFAAERGDRTQCSDLFVVRRVPPPASRTWRYDIRNETGNWTGDIVLDRGDGGWTGRMRSDQIGTWVELRNVQVSASELRFHVPDSAQVYQGRRLPGGRVVGTFTWSGRNWDWAAVETTASSLR